MFQIFKVSACVCILQIHFSGTSLRVEFNITLRRFLCQLKQCCLPNATISSPLPLHPVWGSPNLPKWCKDMRTKERGESPIEQAGVLAWAFLRVVVYQPKNRKWPWGVLKRLLKQKHHSFSGPMPSWTMQEMCLACIICTNYLLKWMHLCCSFVLLYQQLNLAEEQPQHRNMLHFMQIEFFCIQSSSE